MSVKSITIFINNEKLRATIRDIGIDLPKSKEKQEKYEMKKFVSELNWKSKITALAIGCAFTLYSLRPILSHHMLNEPINFPLNLWFWFDPYQTGMFELLYVCIVLFEFFITCLLLGCDLIFYSVAVLLEFCMKVIVMDVEDLAKENQANIDKKLVEIITKYQKITMQTDVIGQIFSIGCLANISLSIVIICMLGFQILVSLTIFFAEELIKFFNFSFLASKIL